MTRSPDLHELFAEWLSSRDGEAAEDPSRDLALHAAGCERCLRLASAADTLSVIDVGAADAPTLRVDAIDERGPLLRVARYAVATAALVLLAGSVAIGSSWLGSIRATDATGLRPTPGEGVLAGVPSATRSPTPTPSASPSRRPSASARTSEAPIEEPAAPTFVIPEPTDQPPPIPPPTALPTIRPSGTPTPTHTAAPTPTANPTATPTPTLAPTPTPTPTPTPSPLPTPAPACSNGLDDDGDLAFDFPADLGCTGPEDDDEAGP